MGDTTYQAGGPDLYATTSMPAQGELDEVVDNIQDAAQTYTNDPFATSVPGGNNAASPEPTMAMSEAPVVQHAGSDQVFSAVQGILDDLVAELRRSIDYYNGRGGTISRIVLCGGGSKLKGLSGYVQRSIDVKCEVYDPMRNLGFSSKKVGMDYVNEYREQLAVAVGNGLHILFD